MTQHILCGVCFLTHYKLTEIDRFNGYVDRVSSFELQMPAQHGYKTMGETIPIYEVTCDDCQTSLHNGTTVYAVTTWKTKGFGSEAEPSRWEDEFKRYR